jgi:hypothetical protein
MEVESKDGVHKRICLRLKKKAEQELDTAQPLALPPAGLEFMCYLQGFYGCTRMVIFSTTYSESAYPRSCGMYELSCNC